MHARSWPARGRSLSASGKGWLSLPRSTTWDGPLDARCAYRIGSVVPPARYWTLALYDGLNPSADRRRGFTSAEILREADGGFFITIGPEARSGNWIPMAEAGPVRLVLRLYDTPVAASSAALDRNALPAIEQLECLP